MSGHVVMKRPVRANEQVFGCYAAAKDSGTWLLHFGFVPWDNAGCDSVAVRVAATFPDGDASEAWSCRARKQSLFAALAGGRMALQLHLSAASPLPPLLLAAARVCCMSAGEAAASDDEARTTLAGPVCAENERAARQFLAALIQRRVDALLHGQDTDSWAATVNAARAQDAVACGHGTHAPVFAVTARGGATAYRDACLRVLLRARDAVCDT